MTHGKVYRSPAWPATVRKLQLGIERYVEALADGSEDEFAAFHGGKLARMLDELVTVAQREAERPEPAA